MNENNNTITDVFTDEIIDAETAVYIKSLDGYSTPDTAKENGYRQCTLCDEWTDDWQHIDGEFVCDDCIANSCEIHYCENCDELHFDSNMTYVPYIDAYVCEDCLSSGYSYCDGCDEWYPNDAGKYIDNECFSGWYSFDWLDDNAHYCTECGEWVDDDHWDDDLERCTDCSIGDLGGLKLIGRYHAHKGEYILPEGHADLIGHEIEVDRDEEDNKALSDMILALHDFDPTLAFEHDGSLDNGVEIITQPKTFDTANSDYYAHILEICKRYGFKAYDTDTCGLHMHINRGYFGEDKVDQDRALAKLMYFFEHHWDSLARVSGRKDFGFCERNVQSVYLPMWQQTIAGRAVTKEASIYMVKYWNDNRYQAINLCNSKTVEIRLMKGTLNVDSFYALTDLVLNIIRFCKLEKWSTITNPYNIEKFKTYLKDTTLNVLSKRGGLY